MKQNRNVATNIQPLMRGRSTPPPRTSAPPHEGRSVCAATAPGTGNDLATLLGMSLSLSETVGVGRHHNRCPIQKATDILRRDERRTLTFVNRYLLTEGNNHATPLGVSLSLSETVGVGRHQHLCPIQEPIDTLPLKFVEPPYESSNHQRGEQWA